MPDTLNSTKTRLQGSNPIPTILVHTRIIDNFGDLGVAYRIAKLLSKSKEFMVVLYISGKLPERFIFDHDVNYLAICTDSDSINIKFDHVITTFSSVVPEKLLLNHSKPVLNIDYLSLKGSDKSWPKRIDIPPSLTDGLITSDVMESGPVSSSEWNLYWFTYHKNIPKGLVRHLSQSQKPVVITTAIDGETKSQGNLTVKTHEFCTQENFDKMLASSHINFVRGEDSFIRSLLTGNLTFWHPYSVASSDRPYFNQRYLDNWPLYLRKHYYSVQKAFLSCSHDPNDFKDIDQLLENYYQIHRLTNEWKAYILSKPCVTKRLERYFDSV